MELREGGTRLDGDWTFGPRGGVGMTSPAADSADATKSSSGAPVVYLGLGVYADFQKGGNGADVSGTGVQIELGYMLGISADESLGDATDGAVYVGLAVKL